MVLGTGVGVGMRRLGILVRSAEDGRRKGEERKEEERMRESVCVAVGGRP